MIEVIKQGDYTRAEEMLIDMNVKHKDDNLERSYFMLNSVFLYGYSHGDSNHSSDSYNVHNYDDPEDFYYDNEDDFDGIDDAETYFYDHND